MARQVLENGVVLPSEYSDDWYDDMTSNLTKLDDVIGSDSEKLSSADVGAAALSNNYNDLDNLPTIPTVNDATLTIQKNGVDVQTFTANASSNVTANITVPTKTSDLTNDSNFVDTSNSAVASGITSAKVTDYDAHIADTDIHVTASDKTTWNTVTSKADDSDVVHKSGNETIAGVKSFSDDTYVKNINFTKEVASSSVSTTSILQLINTVTYTDETASKVATLNFRITADGVKAFYPNENNQYALGLQSRKWSEVRAIQYYYGSSDTEFSDKFVTTDTAQMIGQNKTFTGVITINHVKGGILQLTCPDLDNTVDVTGSWATFMSFNSVDGGQTVASKGAVGLRQFKNGKNFALLLAEGTETLYFGSKSNSDSTKALYPANSGVCSLGTSTNKWSTINGLEPSSLSLPSGNLNDIIDISSYLTYLNGTANTYIAPVNGWISITMNNSSGIQAYITGLWGHQVARPSVGDVRFLMPILKDKTANILIFGGTIDNARFIPCQGNV